MISVKYLRKLRIECLCVRTLSYLSKPTVSNKSCKGEVTSNKICININVFIFQKSRFFFLNACGGTFAFLSNSNNNKFKNFKQICPPLLLFFFLGICLFKFVLFFLSVVCFTPKQRNLLQTSNFEQKNSQLYVFVCVCVFTTIQD